MWTSYLTGLAAVALVSALWLAVQRAWARAFPGVSSDPDVLAGRPGCDGGCGGLGCGGPGRCRRRDLESISPDIPATRGRAAEEDPS